MYYPVPCEREVWYYQDADDNLIRRALNEFMRTNTEKFKC